MERRPYLVNKAFRSFLLSTVMSTMAVSFGSMLGSIVVGNVLGSDSLGAVNVMMPVIQLLAATNALINIGGATVMAVNTGRGREFEARGIFTKCMMMSLVASLAIAILGVVFIDPIIDGLCSTESLRPLAREYGILVFATSPFYILMPGLGTFVRTDNDTRLATFAFAIANVVNIVLAYVLMAYTDMGLSGFAVSTMTGYIVGMAVLAFHFRRDNISIGIGKGTVGSREILTMGSPAALAMMLILVNMLGMNLLVMNHMGSEGMVIRSVCLNIQMLSSIFVSGISQTLQPVGGTLYGSEDLSGMRMVTKIAAKYQIAASGTIMVLALLIPVLFLTIYGVTDPAIVPTAEHCIRLFAPFLIFQAVNYMVMIIFQVFGHRPISIAISFMECFFVLIYGIVLAPMNIDLLWLSFFFGEATVSAVVLAMSLIIRRMRPEYEGFALFRKPTGAVFEASVPGDGSLMTE
ncbi:MAG: MATE family efflux transporter, partial [Candidatus Methanomethylophilaceae archaeon]